MSHRSTYRFSRLLRLLGAVILPALASLALAASADAAGGVDSFGVATGGHLQNEDAATQGRDLDALKAVGASWVRIDINWAQIQNGGPSSYDWTDIDRLVQGATARGMKVLGVLVYTPGWARPAGTSPTFAPDPQKYAAFASAAVSHYSALGVHSYEVWNEPNIEPFWQPSPNIADYTRLLKAAYPAIKNADPQATVLTGGTSPAASNGTDFAPVEFLRGVYAAGGGGSFDAVAHHPYTWPALPGDAQSWSAWYQMYGTNPSLRSVMSENGDGAKKIWATEFGAPTNGPSGSYVSEDVQAQNISRGYSLWTTYDWAGPMFTHHGRDLGTSTKTRENFFGLLRNDFSQKPAWDAYRTAVANAGGTVSPPATAPDSPTTITIKPKGRGGSGKVKGRVAPRRASGGSARADLGKRVELKLYHLVRGDWRPASRSRSAGISRHGRFRIHLRKFHHRLRTGRYRVLAHYPGSPETKASTSKSRAFKVRA